MKKLLAILNLISIIALIFWNYYINTKGINGNTVGTLSDEYSNLFTPAGYAFSIWGIIFLGLLLHGIYQVYGVFSNRNDYEVVTRMGFWLLLANLANCAWLWFWLTERTGQTIFIMLFILSALLMVVFKLKMQKGIVPVSVYRWTWIPISLYAGWITVATVANFSAYLAKIGWTGGWEEMSWAIVMIAVATAVNLLVLFSRNMPVYAGVGVWALVAIAVRHWNVNVVLQWMALSCAILLGVAIVYQIVTARAENRVALEGELS